MQSNVPTSTTTELDFAVNDLGPLAWVLDELRKSLDGAAKALKRFAAVKHAFDALRVVDWAGVEGMYQREDYAAHVHPVPMQKPDRLFTRLGLRRARCAS